MKHKFFIVFLLLICLNLSSFSQTFAQDREEVTPVESPQELTLVRAVMCEGLRGLIPLNEAIAFSIEREEVFCFLDFDPVPEKTSIRISWFWRDERRRNPKFTLKPPRWSTLDSMQLRDADKGPWRVEVRDAEGKNLKTLRFSITD